MRVNGYPPVGSDYQTLVAGGFTDYRLAGGFTDYRLAGGGLVEHPVSEVPLGSAWAG